MRVCEGVQDLPSCLIVHVNRIEYTNQQLTVSDNPFQYNVTECFGNIKYNLTGTVHYDGYKVQGHFYAVVKDRHDNLYEMNDTKVTKIKNKDISSRMEKGANSVVLLFYARAAP